MSNSNFVTELDLAQLSSVTGGNGLLNQLLRRGARPAVQAVKQDAVRLVQTGINESGKYGVYQTMNKVTGALGADKHFFPVPGMPTSVPGQMPRIVGQGGF
jgi:hypothetical protein